MGKCEISEMKEHVAKLEDQISRLKIYRRTLCVLVISVSLVFTVLIFYSFSQKEAHAMSRKLSAVASPTDILGARVSALEKRSKELQDQVNQFIVKALQERDRVRDVFSRHRDVIKSFHSTAFQNLQVYNFPDFVNPRGVKAIDFFRQQIPILNRWQSLQQFSPRSIPVEPVPSPREYTPFRREYTPLRR